MNTPFFGRMIYYGYLPPDPGSKCGSYWVRVYIEDRGWTENIFNHKKIQIGDNYAISKRLADKLLEIQKEHGEDVRLAFTIFQGWKITDLWLPEDKKTSVRE